MHNPINAAFALAALLLVGPLPVQAGSITEDSIVDQNSALQNAMDQLPKGATVTGTRCIQIVTPGDSYRYRCSVDYTTTGSPSAPGP